MTWSLVGQKQVDLAATSAVFTATFDSLTGGTNSSPSAGDLVVVSASGVGTSSGVFKVNSLGWLWKEEIGDDSYDSHYIIAAKVMGATVDTGIEIERYFTNGSYGIAACIDVWRNSDGVDHFNLLDVALQLANGANNGNPDPPSITPTTSGTKVFAGGAGALNDIGSAYTQAGLSNFAQVVSDPGYASRVAMGNVDWTSGAVNIAQFGGGVGANASAAWASAALAVKPGPVSHNWELVGYTKGEYATSGTTLSIDLTGIDMQEGDAVVVFHFSVHSGAQSDNACFIDTTGYSTASADASDTYDGSAILGVKVMGATPDTTVELSRTLGYQVSPLGGGAQVAVVRGGDTSNILDTAIILNGGSDTGIPQPSAITTVTNNALVFVVGSSNGSTTIDPYTTTELTYINQLYTDPGYATQGGLMPVLRPTAGSYTPTTWGGGASFTSSSYIFGAIALRPGAGGTNYTLTASGGSFALTGTAATLKAGRVISAGSGSFTLSGTAANLSKGFSLTANAGSFTLSGTAATLKAGRVLSAGAGTFTLTGTAAALARGFYMAAGAGSYTLSGTAAVLQIARYLSAGAGSFTLTGTDANLITVSSYTMAADAGSFVLTGSDAGLLYGRVLTAGAGSFALTGTNAALIRALTLAAGSGAFALTGASAGLIADRILTASAGSYVLTGSAASLYQGRYLSAGAGSFTLSGTDAGLSVALGILAEGGAFILSGTDATLTYHALASYTLTAEGGVFVLEGGTVLFYHRESGGWTIIDNIELDWTQAAAGSGTWTEQAAATGTWTQSAAGMGSWTRTTDTERDWTLQ